MSKFIRFRLGVLEGGGYEKEKGKSSHRGVGGGEWGEGLRENTVYGLMKDRIGNC